MTKATRIRPTDPRGWTEPRIDQREWESGEYAKRRALNQPALSNPIVAQLYESRIGKVTLSLTEHEKTHGRRPRPAGVVNPYARQDAAEVEV
jgi:hypothetical protein